MTSRREELERPSEWLRSLRESADGYAELLRESGEIAIAAYRVAAARCRAGSLATPVPNLREVHAAAREVQGGLETPVPPMAALRDDCLVAGLLVIST